MDSRVYHGRIGVSADWDVVVVGGGPGGCAAAVAAARAGLLHDLYLCDWKKARVSPWQRLLVHPQMALENAEQFGLSELERDIILKHMWPVTLRRIPRHRESVVVNLADKLCASAEFLRIYNLAHAGERLLEFNRRRLLRQRRFWSVSHFL